MAALAVEKPKARPVLALIAILFALGAPMVQIALRPLLESNFSDWFSRFLSLWVMWIAIAFALFVSVRLEGIPLATFGITRNKRSLRYRLIELIAAVLCGLLVTIVLVASSNFLRQVLNTNADAGLKLTRFIMKHGKMQVKMKSEPYVTT